MSLSGSVANFMEEVLKGQLPLSVRKLGGQGGELTLQRHLVIDSNVFHLYSASRAATPDEEAEDVTSLSDRT